MRFSKAPITLILLLIFTTANKFNPVAQYATANNKSSDGELLAKIQSILEPLESVIDTSIFLTQLFTPSTIYKFKDLNAALEVVALDGIANIHFYLGDPSDLGYEYGLINLSAFLAQSMKETIQYDACDENNWDIINMKYPIANACGQLGQSYQDYHCSSEEDIQLNMECPIDTQMEITATTHAAWYGAPPGLFCAPKTKFPVTGVWDQDYWCDNKWEGESCDVYEGQKSGRFDNDVGVANQAGRTDVEGCCWWGRGVIQSTGVCNYGKLNYYLGKRAADEGRSSRYPDIDFCKTPDAICSSEDHTELKWIAGLFYWMKDVQSYNNDGWYYLAELHKFVNGGMTDMSFIDAVSGIVNRGCHNPPCATGEVDGLLDRRNNFQKVMTAFGLPSVGIGGMRPPSTIPPLPSPNNGPIYIPVVDVENTGGIFLSQFIDTLLSNKEDIEHKVLSYQVNGVFKLSELYTFDALIKSLTSAYQVGHDGNNFYLGSSEDGGSPSISTTTAFSIGKSPSVTINNSPSSSSMLKVGLANIAAFLAQSITEHIQDNACDEGNLDLIEDMYFINNGCQKLGIMYPEIDFCSGRVKDVCKQIGTYPTLMWDIAFFEWIENVQSYDDHGWNYRLKLEEFVDGDLNDISFINAVSRIVVEGNSDFVGKVPNSAQRWGNFELLLTTLKLKDPYPAYTVRMNAGVKEQPIYIVAYLWVLLGLL